MLRIRQEQMAVFAEYMRDQFELRMIAHLRETFPERTADLDDAHLHKAVKQALDKAQQYDIEYEDDIRRLLEYMVIYGPRLDVRERTRWLGEILRLKHIDGTKKMDLIDEAELTILREGA